MRLKNILFIALALFSAGVFFSCKVGTPADIEVLNTTELADDFSGHYALTGEDSSLVISVSSSLNQDSLSTATSILITNIGNNTVPLTRSYQVNLVRKTELADITLYSTNIADIIFYQKIKTPAAVIDTLAVIDTTETELERSLKRGDTTFLSVESNVVYLREK